MNWKDIVRPLTGFTKPGRDDTASVVHWTAEFANHAGSEEAPRVYAIIASVYVVFYVFMTAFMRIPERIWRPYPEKEISL